MAIQQDDTDERETRVKALAERFRAAEKRALLKRGIELWTSTEDAMLDLPALPVVKLH
jgi:hypothetical protein